MNIIEEISRLVDQLEEAIEEANWSTVEIIKEDLLTLNTKLEMGDDSFMDFE